MILMSMALLALGVADLVRWTPERVSWSRGLAAAGAGVLAPVLLALLSGQPGLLVALSTVGAAVVVTAWVAAEHQPLASHGPGWPLGLVSLVLVLLFALSGLGEPASGPLQRWYAGLGFPLADVVPVDQFLLAVCAAVFLLASTNRVVRLVLEAAGTPVLQGETVLKGGRMLGPMERLLVAGLVLSGQLTGAAVVVAAKGLLRLPEIRSKKESRAGGDDHVAEYFLIGTLASWLVATALAALVAVSG